MIPGTGPERGFPWWRGGLLLSLRRAVGVVGAEPASRRREGRMVAVIRRPR